MNIPDKGIVVTAASVLPDWLDYNEHMNISYYLVAFETGIDAYKALVGIDLDYIATRKRSTVALESHITYQREAALGDRLRIETRLIDFDGKRAHIYQEIYRDRELLATQEVIAISFDTAARRSAPFEEQVAENYRRLVAAQADLPRPRWVGRAVGLSRGRPSG